MDSISNENRLVEDKYVFVNANEEEIKKYRLDKYDFLFNTRNSYELVGKTCVYTPKNDILTLFNNNIMRVKFKEGISSEFVNYAFSSKLVKDRLEKLKSGTTSVVGIYYKGLKDLMIPITNISEQKVICDKLNNLSSETQKLESIYQNKIKYLVQLKKSILQKAFNGEL